MRDRSLCKIVEKSVSLYGVHINPLPHTQRESAACPDLALSGPLGEPLSLLLRVRLLHFYEQQIEFLERHAHEHLEPSGIACQFVES